MADEKEGIPNGDVGGEPQTREGLDAQDGEEYQAISDELDQLNNCLDELENWNDSLSLRMREFLETIKKSHQEENVTEADKIQEKMDLDK